MVEKSENFSIRVFYKPNQKESDVFSEPIVSEPREEEPIQKKEELSVTSHRKEDHKAEQELAYFLDKYLYGRFPTGNALSSIRRINDKIMQLDGVDVEFNGIDGRVYYIDEKAQLHYLNKNIPTFAFELLSRQKSYETPGWLLNSKLKTDFYMLIWPFATQDSYENITWAQFTKADCLLVQKQRILKMLSERGLTVDKMQKDAQNIRVSVQSGKIPIPGISGIYYYASYPQYYKEVPINIVVSKHILQSIAQRRYIVTPDDVTTE